MRLDYMDGFDMPMGMIGVMGFVDDSGRIHISGENRMPKPDMDIDARR